MHRYADDDTGMLFWEEEAKLKLDPVCRIA